MFTIVRIWGAQFANSLQHSSYWEFCLFPCHIIFYSVNRLWKEFVHIIFIHDAARPIIHCPTIAIHVCQHQCTAAHLIQTSPSPPPPPTGQSLIIYMYCVLLEEHRLETNVSYLWLSPLHQFSIQHYFPPLSFSKSYGNYVYNIMFVPAHLTLFTPWKANINTYIRSHCAQ